MKKIRMPVGSLKRRMRLKLAGDTGHSFRQHQTVVEIERDKKLIAKAINGVIEGWKEERSIIR